MTAARVAAAALAAVTMMACDRSSDAPGGTVTVVVEYPGASPVEVEQGVLDRIEEAVGQVDGVHALHGSARAGVARLSVTFRRGVDALTASGRVREALATLGQRLPVAASVPMVFTRRPGAWIYATIDDDPRTAAAIRDRVQREPGVIEVETCGVREARVVLELAPDRLAAMGLTAGDVADVIAASNVDLPGGRLTEGDTQVAIRVTGALTSFDAVATLPIGDAGARVRDVAAITERSETDCVAVGTPGGALMRVGVHLPRDVAATAKVLGQAGAAVLRGPVTLRDHEQPGAVHERARVAADLIARGGKGWYAVVPRDGEHFELVVDGPDPWRGGVLLQATVADDQHERVMQQVDDALISLRGGGNLAAVEQRGAGRRPELHLEIDRTRAAELGVSAHEIARVLAISHGERAGSYLAGGDQRLDVVVTVDGGAEHWHDLRVRGSGGTLVPLDRVVKVEQRLTPAEILHRDRRRVGVVWVQGKPGAPAASVRQLLAAALPGATIGAVEPRFVAAEHW